MKEPRKEDYGYQDGGCYEESGWLVEGGKEAYEIAMEEYSKAFDESFRLAYEEVFEVMETPITKKVAQPIIKEFIICAATYYNDGLVHENTPVNIDIGFVICGRRHYNCESIFKQIATDIANFEQGFITNTNRFVNRKEAYKIAFDANQIIGPNKGYSENEIGLTSEDLY